FYDALRFDEKTTFEHFDFNRKPELDAKASAKAAELLKHSQYGDQLDTAEEFVTELRERSHEIPNLISPRLGDAKILQLPVAANSEVPAASHIVALPLGGRIQVNPWDDSLSFLKSPPPESVTRREKMPFEITPFDVYLTRAGETGKASQSAEAASPAN
ncbi:MAG: hypothetical protein ACRD4Y_01175, partial [Candidatus Acidiferrales bacterium]